MVAKEHVRAKFHRAKCSRSRVICVQRKKTPTKTIQSVATARTVLTRNVHIGVAHCRICAKWPTPAWSALGSWRGEASRLPMHHGHGERLLVYQSINQSITRTCMYMYFTARVSRFRRKFQSAPCKQRALIYRQHGMPAYTVPRYHGVAMTNGPVTNDPIGVPTDRPTLQLLQ